MKNLFKPFFHIVPLLFVGLLACEEPEKNPSPEPDPIDQPEDGLVTPVGSPIGAPVSKVIGPQGGVIEVPGSHMIFRFPAGAIAQNTTITVTPVENNAPLGVGQAFEIAPKDVKLLKDAEMQWNYDETTLEGSVPEALSGAFQDEKGVWQSHKDVALDKNAKTVKAPVTRLAHYSFYEQFYIKASKTTLALGEQAELTVYFHQDRSDPNSDEKSLLAPLTPPKVVSGDRVVKWVVNGEKAGSEFDDKFSEGTITEDQKYAKAVYTAPLREPDISPVSVGAQIDLKQFGHVMVLLYMHIEGKSFVQIENRYDSSPIVGLTISGNSLSGMISDSTSRRLMMTFYIKNFKGNGTYNVTEDGSVAIAPTIVGNVPYLYGFYKDVTWISGGGKIVITGYKGSNEPISGAISGKFFEPFLDGRIETREASSKFRAKASVAL